MLALVITLGAGAACRAGDSLAPGGRTGPPYLAIVSRFQAPDGANLDRPIRYRVEDLSLNFNIDTTLTVLPADTVILSVPASTYRVTMLDVPSTCTVRGQVSQVEVIADDVNTLLFRYVVFCQAQLVVENLTGGVFVDNEYVYRVTDSLGNERIGLIGGADTVLFDQFAPGPATVHLSHVSENCIVITNGGNEQRVRIPATGGVSALFRVHCSDPRQTPVLLSAAATLSGGFNGVVFHAVDPDRDLERLFWDITDCRRNSLLKKGGRIRSGLSSGRTLGVDSILAMAAFETEVPDAEIASGCASIRLEDRAGNSTQFTEIPLSAPRAGSAPFPLTFNASFVGTQAIRTTIIADDPDDDFLGVFATARLRDGVLFPKDGAPDIGVFNTTGFLDTRIPDLLLGNGRIPYTDYLAVILYLFDHKGNFTRVEDNDLFR